MRLDSSLNIALNEQDCLGYPGPKTGYRRVLGLMKINIYREGCSREGSNQPTPPHAWLRAGSGYWYWLCWVGGKWLDCGGVSLRGPKRVQGRVECRPLVSGCRLVGRWSNWFGEAVLLR